MNKPQFKFGCCWRTQITCRNNSAGPRIRNQQCVVSLVHHLISSGDMIPLCGRDIVWVAPRMHRSLSARPQSLQQVPQCPWFILKWFTVHGCFLGRPYPGGQIIGFVTVDHRSRTPITVPRETIKACVTLADVEVDEGHYW